MLKTDFRRKFGLRLVATVFVLGVNWAQAQNTAALSG